MQKPEPQMKKPNWAKLSFRFDLFCTACLIAAVAGSWHAGNLSADDKGLIVIISLVGAGAVAAVVGLIGSNQRKD